ncbi:helix-turn-helix transcriptional regulator [Mucilaginibacter paludis]|uniref:Helix-turn-helix, AraC domain-containing protein n=1 Tax=Mucilaginibacter paludis DSM 18603 TaxID=714943 RepID=H1Y413_9SPHI|nr:AraC family transcriptional regulator [Mucilaginibacter paludis]EHQ30958.1 Helix-turn-helix, AraC domain-containing protein [Mucilaginibacter paludis DSM 18603]
MQRNTMQSIGRHTSQRQWFMKRLFLEAKIVELFLAQATQLDNRADISRSSGLTPIDIERLYGIKSHLDNNFHEDFSIIDLAKEAGINQTKLKFGFKKIFNTTVFGYINDIRLMEAKRLLLEEKLYVNEVAYKVGFKYPHYFSAVFKKKLVLFCKLKMIF